MGASFAQARPHMKAINRLTHLFVPGEVGVRVRIAVLSDVVQYVEEQAACYNTRE